MAGKRSKNGTRMKAMGGGAMMKKKNYAKGGRAKLSEGSKPQQKNPTLQERFRDAEQPMKPEGSPRPTPATPATPATRKKNKVDKAMEKRKKAMGGGAMMKKKNYAKGGPARTKMANGGKMVKGPYS